MRIPKLISWVYDTTPIDSVMYIEMEWFKSKERAEQVLKNFMNFERGLDLCSFTQDFKRIKISKDGWVKEFNNK